MEPGVPSPVRCMLPAQRIGRLAGAAPRPVNFAQRRRGTVQRFRGASSRTLVTTRNATGSTQTMTTTKTLQALLIGALLASSAVFADSSIQVDVVAGKQQAKFS